MNPLNNNLLIIGAGQYGHVAYVIAQAMGCFGKIAFLDDSYIASAEDSSIIGTSRDIEKFAADYRYGFVAIGNPEVRRCLTEQLQFNCIIPAILVHPTAYVSPSAQLQKGCCVEPLAVVQTNAVVATASIVASGAIVRHDAFVGEFSLVDSNAVVESTAIVPAETKIHCNSVFCQEQGVGLQGHNIAEGLV